MLLQTDRDPKRGLGCRGTWQSLGSKNGVREKEVPAAEAAALVASRRSLKNCNFDLVVDLPGLTMERRLFTWSWRTDSTASSEHKSPASLRCCCTKQHRPSVNGLACCATFCAGSTVPPLLLV